MSNLSGRTASERSKRTSLYSSLLICRFAIPLILVSPSGCNSLGTSVRPPGQPASGPGGADYKHASITAERFGEGRDEYWLFSPADPPASAAPFVVFLHGWSAMDPAVYGAWIRHIVRRGHIVVYPRYQDSLLTNAADMQEAAADAIAAAWDRLKQNGQVDPQQAGVVWIGHSLGAGFTALLAPKSQELGLPPPAALMIVEPGRTDAADIGQLPGNTKVLLVVGEDDSIAGSRTAGAIASHLSYLGDNVETVTFRSERRSFPQLIADHFAPLAFTTAFEAEILGPSASQPATLRQRRQERRRDQYPPNALDYYGFWKLGDGLLDWAYRGENLEYAFGDTPQQRFMGTLSDGQPIAPLLIRVP